MKRECGVISWDRWKVLDCFRIVLGVDECGLCLRELGLRPDAPRGVQLGDAADAAGELGGVIFFRAFSGGLEPLRRDLQVLPRRRCGGGAGRDR